MLQHKNVAYDHLTRITRKKCQQEGVLSLTHRLIECFSARFSFALFCHTLCYNFITFPAFYLCHFLICAGWPTSPQLTAIRLMSVWPFGGERAQTHFHCRERELTSSTLINSFSKQWLWSAAKKEQINYIKLKKALFKFIINSRAEI